ncbi:hypothetical protein [Angustibacter luteus]|uniref:DUF11 domain-containing protein n=1 Tax=Angustibacter luteus TaxID=658456 RepID=A0ABW1JE00_9ACTN
MGYEVLDAEGGQVDLPRADLPPTELGPAPPDGTPAPPDGSPARRPRPRRPEVTATTSLAVLLGGSLLVGAIAGGLWASRHAGLNEQAAQASQLSVVAIVTNVDAVRAERVADFTVKVVNAGPRPLDLVTSGPAERPRDGHQVVQSLGGAVTVPAGGSLSANIRLRVDCASKTDPRSLLRVPLRTSDGTVHQVAVADQDVLDSGYPVDSPCASPDDPVLQAHLTGSVSRPQLTLHNNADSDVSVTLDTEHSPFVAQTTNFSVLRLSPALPQVLGPKQTLTLTLSLTPWSCPRSLSEVVDTQLSPYVVLRAGTPDAPALLQEPVGLDLSTVWGAALARECT